jgi:hypothetical protein
LNFRKSRFLTVIAAVALAAVLCAGCALINTDVPEIDSIPLGQAGNSDGIGNLGGIEMTLDDVRKLAKKGDDLVFEDLAAYRGSSGVSADFPPEYYRMALYPVEDDYWLIVNSPKSGKPDSIVLVNRWETPSNGIDIRDGDLDEFLSQWPIVMRLQEGTLTPSGAVFVLKNATDNAYTYGDYYKLQRRDNAAWADVAVVFTENLGFYDIGYLLAARQAAEITIDWERLYGELPAGAYRLVKIASFLRAPGDSDKYTLFAAFTLDGE